MTSIQWHVAVLIPARDEEELLPDCLAAIQVARKNLSHIASTDVVVVCDRSTDRTQSISERILGHSGVVMSTQSGNVGTARALAAKLALSRTTLRREYVWLANTDADSIVPPDWLCRQMEIADAGFDAVAGIVDLSPSNDEERKLREQFRLSYSLETDGSHAHVHGANLGVRADAYLKAGGWANLSLAEDHDLWKRLLLSGARSTSRSDLKVMTSGRLVGRAIDGFASALAAHKEAAA